MSQQGLVVTNSTHRQSNLQVVPTLLEGCVEGYPLSLRSATVVIAVWTATTKQRRNFASTDGTRAPAAHGRGRHRDRCPAWQPDEVLAPVPARQTASSQLRGGLRGAAGVGGGVAAPKPASIPGRTFAATTTSSPSMVTLRALQQGRGAATFFRCHNSGRFRLSTGFGDRTSKGTSSRVYSGEIPPAQPRRPGETLRVFSFCGRNSP